MNRKNALNLIRVEFAEHGRPTTISTRAYVEHNIGFAAYSSALRAGMAIYRETHKDE
jgi:hypothetical protein